MHIKLTANKQILNGFRSLIKCIKWDHSCGRLLRVQQLYEGGTLSNDCTFHQMYIIKIKNKNQSIPHTKISTDFIATDANLDKTLNLKDGRRSHSNMKRIKKFASSPDPGLCCRYEFWSTSYFFNSIIGKVTFWYCISCCKVYEERKSIGIIIRTRIMRKSEKGKKVKKRNFVVMLCSCRLLRWWWKNQDKKYQFGYDVW